MPLALPIHQTHFCHPPPPHHVLPASLIAFNTPNALLAPQWLPTPLRAFTHPSSPSPPSQGSPHVMFFWYTTLPKMLPSPPSAPQGTINCSGHSPSASVTNNHTRILKNRRPKALVTGRRHNRDCAAMPSLDHTIQEEGGGSNVTILWGMGLTNAARSSEADAPIIPDEHTEPGCILAH